MRYDLSKELPIQCKFCLYKFKFEDYEDIILPLLETNEKINNELLDFSSLSPGKISINNFNLKNEDINNKEKYINKEISPEELAIEYYHSRGYNAIYSENNYWILLLIMLFYKDKFYKYNEAEFSEYIKSINYDDFNNINKMIENIFDNYLMNQIQKKKGNPYIFIRRPDGSGFFSVFDLFNAVIYLLPKQLELIVRKMFPYFLSGINGLPDLIVFDEKNFFFVEVKSKNDELRSNQIKWHKYLAEIVKIDVILFTIDKSAKSIELLKNIYEDCEDYGLLNYKNLDKYFYKIELTPDCHNIWGNDYKAIILVYSISHTKKEEGVKEFYRVIEYTNEEYESYRKYLRDERKIVDEYISNIYEKSSNLFFDYTPTKKQNDRNKEAKLLVLQNDFQKAIDLYEKNVYEKCSIPTTYEQLFKLYMKSKNFDRIIEISSQAVSIFHQMGDENNSKRFANIIHQAWHYKSMNEFRFIEYITEEENNYLYDKYGKDSVKKEVNKLTNQIEKRYNRNESIDGLVVTSKSRKLMSSLEYIL